MAEQWDAVVVGAGPAGLMAAEELGRAGHRVLVAEAKPSVARKFLTARGGDQFQVADNENCPSYSSSMAPAIKI